MYPPLAALRRILFAFALVGSFAGPGARAGTMLAENFDAYSSDADLASAGWEAHDENHPRENAAWTVLDPGGRLPPARQDGSPSEGVFVISDSDHASGNNTVGSGMSHDLCTPVFSAGGFDRVWLHFSCTAQLNNDGDAVFEVDVTTDGAVSWSNVFRRVAPSRTGAPPLASRENADGLFGRVDLDLSSLAANREAVRVRFRHFEPTDDWWVAIDDVVIDDQAPPSGGNATLLSSQGFDDGIPADWTVRSDLDPKNEGPAGWIASDPCERSIVGQSFPRYQGHAVHRLGDRFAILDAGCSLGAKDEYLITPPIDCLDCDRVFLQVKNEIEISSDAVQEIIWSRDGGATFEPDPLVSFHRGAGFRSEEEPFYREDVFEVPGAAHADQLVFAFHYSGKGESFWAIDDVKVTGTLPGGNVTRFRRGDVDGNGQVEITDAIRSLGYLFLGDPTSLECLDAADADDSGKVDISDAIASLTFQFLGGAPPAEPGPTVCGPDARLEFPDLGCAEGCP